MIELTRNGYDESEIERLIEVTNARFVVDVDGLLALSEANVADEIITLMLERGAEPPGERSEVDQLIALREAGFTEETMLLFVRHRNICELLPDEDARRLGRAGFSSAFMRGFNEHVESCREEREALVLVEPVEEEVYEVTPVQPTRVYRTDTTVYPSTVRYPTTYYPPRHYGIYDSYYYHNRNTRVYPLVVYRDYSGHKHRHRKAGHRHGKASHRDHDRRGHRGDGRRAEHKGDRQKGDRDRRRADRRGDRQEGDRDRRRADRRGDRQEGDRDRRRRRDSSGGSRQPQPRSDPGLLVGNAPTSRMIPPVGRPEQVRRGVGRRVEDPVPVKPFVPSAGRSERAARPRSPGLPGDARRRVERPEAPVRGRVIPVVRPDPIGRRSPEPRFRPPSRTPSVTPPAPTPRVTPPAPAPRMSAPPRTLPVAPPPVVRQPRVLPSVTENVRMEKVETHDQ